MSFRELKIKTNVVKRISKEQISYGKELESQQKRIDKLIADGADEADVRKQKEVLEETVQMIPDVKRRLAAAVQELSTMVVRKLFKRCSGSL
ncbi:hypothetical protein K450DRAFT_175207 [Umbelopsis ramanniana AG]|uniref:Tubulin-specific chaperone A n=1 Tax=Umbelopsis ramanniana AG TaxID=1314678 RepID=A0AAD5HCP5_UMBRA|nr:uncharacterized protein K450DRAFT_175207 [Umbelopsis ramanniana AG]KAI8579287.1 hypothetical protein K450DRAFT_175207 [Umbelopsis ramanniana AG]